ncbi:MAG TPA: BolA/IbaG family iron-sulfur metabolism protein [Candidatus Eremiobacteraceae bacterium]
MITHEEIETLIREKLPDAVVQAHDRTGTLDHYNLTVVSREFTGMPLLDRNRLIYTALGEALKDGSLHAVEIKTGTPA